MGTNLVSIIMQFLTPDMIARIASALGLTRSDAQSGISAAVPGLLAVLANAAAKPGGAQTMVDTVRQQSGLQDSLSGILGGSGQSAFIERGSSMLGSLLGGGQDQSMLAGVIDRIAGIGQNASNSLLGMLAPVVMGLIGKQIGIGNLNAGSLTSLFASQKEQIAQAMPAGMGRLLGSAGLLDSLSGVAGSVAGSAASAAEQASRAASGAAGQVSQFTASTAARTAALGQRAADTASGVPAWIYWVIPLAALAGLLWYLFANPREQVAQQPAPSPTALSNVMVDGVEINKQVSDTLGQLQTSLSGITNVESARAALPKLQTAMGQIDRVSSVAERLPAEQRKVVGGLIASTMATINALFDKVLAIPGVAEVLNPTVDRLRTKLADLSGQPSTVGSGR